MEDITRKTKEVFSDKIPLYNIRILRSYIDYVQNNYPNVDIRKVLKYAGVLKTSIE